MSRRAIMLGMVLWALLALVACGPESASNGVANESGTQAGSSGGQGMQSIADESVSAIEGTGDAFGPGAEELLAAMAGQVVTIAVNAQFRPFVYRDAQSERADGLAGFDIELMESLAAEGGYTVAYVDLPFEQLLPATARGEYDAAISAITITEERARIVDFSEPYFQTGQAALTFLDAGQGLAVRTEESTLFAVDDLTPASRVGVKLDTTGDSYVTQQLDVDVIRYDEVAPLIAALESGEVDAIVVDTSVIARSIDEQSQIRLTQTGLTQEAYAIAVNKDRGDLLAALNIALARLQEQGIYDELFEKHFGTP